MYKIKLFNQDKGGATGENAAARIDSMATVNTMDQYYRLQHIYIPSFLIDDEWFQIKTFTLNLNGNNLPVKVIKGEGENGFDSEGNYAVYVNDTKTVQGETVYTVNVENIIRDLYSKGQTKYASAYTNGTNNQTYLKAHVSSFNLNFYAVHGSRLDGTTVLGDGEYLSADKTANHYSFLYDGVYADRTVDNFLSDNWDSTSTPTFGKDPNTYPARTSTNKVYSKFT